jgi:hypothetical protein
MGATDRRNRLHSQLAEIVRASEAARTRPLLVQRSSNARAGKKDHAMNLQTIVIILSAIVFGGPLVGNALIFVLRAFGKSGAADTVARFSPLVFKAVQIVEDVALAPTNSERVKVALSELEGLADELGDARIARVSLMLQAATGTKPAKPTAPIVPPGVVAIMWLVAVCVVIGACTGCGSSLPVCAAWGSARVGDKGALPVCEKWESPPPSASASAEPSASAK